MINHKTGYVAILGLPNAGKSTLLNALLGQKLSIITSKPQTTRKRILGILSEDNYQIIFLDTPGIISPSYLLQEKMMDDVKSSVKDADVILLLIDLKDDPGGDKLLSQEFVEHTVSQTRKPRLLILNKVDLINQDEVKDIIKIYEGKNLFEEVIPVSATLNFNTERVVEDIVNHIPEGPRLFPGDQLTDENERFYVAEIVREKIFELFRDEVPYSCEVLIISFNERDDKKDYVSAEIVVEKESQKAIIIGKGGSSIKKLGKFARESIEQFLQREIFLELRVKVRKKWRGDESLLKSFGYGKNK